MVELKWSVGAWNNARSNNCWFLVLAFWRIRYVVNACPDSLLVLWINLHIINLGCAIMQLRAIFQFLKWSHGTADFALNKNRDMAMYETMKYWNTLIIIILICLKFEIGAFVKFLHNSIEFVDIGECRAVCFGSFLCGLNVVMLIQMKSNRKKCQQYLFNKKL